LSSIARQSTLAAMWWETEGEDFVKGVFASGAGVRDGVGRLLEYFKLRHPHPVWRRMAALDFDADAESIRDWFVDQFPFPDTLAVCWFAFWDVTTGFDLRGASDWSEDPEDWEWWYHDDYHGDAYESPVLAAMHELVDDAEAERVRGGVADLTEFLLTIGYVGLVAGQVFREVDRRRLLGRRDERWVVTGFPDAVYGAIVGRVTAAAGFEPFGRRRGRRP
jgi:hypothetical protein